MTEQTVYTNVYVKNGEQFIGPCWESSVDADHATGGRHLDMYGPREGAFVYRLNITPKGKE